MLARCRSERSVGHRGHRSLRDSARQVRRHRQFTLRWPAGAARRSPHSRVLRPATMLPAPRPHHLTLYPGAAGGQCLRGAGRHAVRSKHIDRAIRP
jgi:hypothetical protein